MKQKVSHELIEIIKDMNKVSKAVAFEFFDVNGKYATKTKKPYVRATIEFANGKKYKMNAATFEAFDEFKFHVGIDRQ
jgi:hypothetical protein